MKLSHVLFNRVRLLGALLVLLVVASLYLPASGEPATPTATDRQIAQLVAMLLPRDHLSRHPLDEEMSPRPEELPQEPGPDEGLLHPGGR